VGDELRRRRAGTERETERTDEPGDDMTGNLLLDILVILAILALVVFLVRGRL
jgi:hypothetical protein